MKKMLFYFGLGILLFALSKNTLPVKYLAPACYRISCAMAVILFMAVSRKPQDKRIWLVLGIKELLVLLFGNPGVSFGMHLLLTIFNIMLDVVMLMLFLKVCRYQGKQLVKSGVVAIGLYALGGLFLNWVCMARLYAFAYHATYSELLMVAGRYNNKVQGTWSFLVWSVAPFYVVQAALNIVIVLGLLKFFGKYVLAVKEKKGGMEYVECNRQ